MKATITFNLPEESEDHELAINAGKWHSIVWKLDSWLRTYTKHGNPKEANAEDVREKLHEFLNEENLLL